MEEEEEEEGVGEEEGGGRSRRAKEEERDHPLCPPRRGAGEGAQAAAKAGTGQCGESNAAVIER